LLFCSKGSFGDKSCSVKKGRNEESKKKKQKIRDESWEVIKSIILIPSAGRGAWPEIEGLNNFCKKVNNDSK
jgi:hypothetical protein